MVLPLYAGHGVPKRYSRGFNTGLWYDKFFGFWNTDWSVGEDEKKRWIQEVCTIPVGDKALLDEAILRLTRLVLALVGEYRCFSTDWRFVTGLGRPHPVENGFAWHHTLGVPFLPGSSVKGIVRTWAEKWVDPPVSDDVLRIFGPDGEVRDKHVGSVIFFDALPVKPVKLEADVMTPHYLDYYQQERPEKPPGDWYDPVPIPLLTVAPGQTFIFAVAPRRSADEQSRADCRLAMEWLTDALAVIGAGSKTAVGYGRFTRQEKTEAEIRHNRAMSDVEGVQAAGRSPGTSAEEPKLADALSPIREEMEKDGYSSDPERFIGFLTSKWLKRLQDEEFPPDVKQEIAVLLKEWYMTYKTEQWRKPNKKNAAKIAEIKKFLPDDA